MKTAFYVLKTQKDSHYYHFTTRLIAKIMRMHQHAFLVSDDEHINPLSKALWEFDASSFIAHEALIDTNIFEAQLKCVYLLSPKVYLEKISELEALKTWPIIDVSTEKIIFTHSYNLVVIDQHERRLITGREKYKEYQAQQKNNPDHEVKLHTI